MVTTLLIIAAVLVLVAMIALATVALESCTNYVIFTPAVNALGQLFVVILGAVLNQNE